VQFKIIWLIVCSSFSPQGHVELGIILNLWRYDMVKPCSWVLWRVLVNSLWRMNFRFPVKVENYVIELLFAFQERLFSGVR